MENEIEIAIWGLGFRGPRTDCQCCSGTPVVPLFLLYIYILYICIYIYIQCCLLGGRGEHKPKEHPY